MYSHTKIPEPFCRRQTGREAEAAPTETRSSPEKPQSAEARQDSLPLLAFLLMELFR